MAQQHGNTMRTGAAKQSFGRHGQGRGSRMTAVKPKNFRKTLRRLLQFMRPYWLQLGAVIAMTALGTICSSLSPRVMGYATNIITAGIPAFSQAAAGVDFAALGRMLGVLFGIYLLTALLRYGQGVLMAVVSQRTMFDLREAVDKKLAKLPLQYYDTHPYGEILSRVTNDVDTVSDSLQTSITQMFQSTLTIVVILTMMLSISPMLTLVGILTIPPSLLFSMLVIRKTQHLFRGQQAAMGRMNGYIEEMYSGHSVIKSYGRETETVEAFRQINQELQQYSQRAQFISGIIMPVVSFFGNLGYVLVTVMGAGYVLQGRLLLGDIQAFIRYLKQLSGPINETAGIMNVLQSTIAAAERIFEVLDEEEELPDPAAPQKIAQPNGSVEFRGVDFAYQEDKPLIHGLDLHVYAGEKVAIVGPTGAGKTTLVNLLMRFYDVTQGSIHVDGVDIRQLPREELRSLFGMVLQDTWLFQGTIRENIRYGRPDATDEEVEQAAKLAHAHHFIMQLPNGYDFTLGEDAENISQGQRQLITIARAILSDPTILILDEATSSVDTRTEVLIQKAMVNLMQGRTSFIIAHRLSTIRDADTILVMNDGNIVEQGNHETLLRANGVYAELYNSQFAFANHA